MARYRPLREKRRQLYLNNGFLPFEANDLSGVSFAEAPYLRKMVRERASAKRSFDKQADALKWSETKRREEWRNYVRSEYLNNRWIRPTETWRVGRTRYQASVWEMLKDFRQKAIDAGEYHPIRRRGVRREGDKLYIHILKGDVEGQRRRSYAKIKSSKGTSDYERYLEQRRAQKARSRQREKLRRHPMG